ncbi:oligosaccharide flippase family protein, partial [Escherichia coli]
MTPLITIPIISRAFGPSGVGIVSFSFNIVQYFLMIASVGVQLYFNRVIAKSVNDKRQLSQQFWDIFVSKLFLALTVFAMYMVVITRFIDDCCRRQRGAVRREAAVHYRISRVRITDGDLNIVCETMFMSRQCFIG